MSRPKSGWPYDSAEGMFAIDAAYFKREALQALRTYVEPVVALGRFVAGAPIIAPSAIVRRRQDNR